MPQLTLDMEAVVIRVPQLDLIYNDYTSSQSATTDTRHGSCSDTIRVVRVPQLSLDLLSIMTVNE